MNSGIHQEASNKRRPRTMARWRLSRLRRLKLEAAPTPRQAARIRQLQRSLGD